MKRRVRGRLVLAVMVGVGCAAAPVSAAGKVDPASRAEAARILAATGVRGGLVVHVGCGDGKLTAALRADDRYLVHGLDADAAKVHAAQEHIRSLGLYGPVSADRWTMAPQLPYTDGLVNLVVASEGSGVADAEVQRVLAPGGVAYVQRSGQWTKTVKPWPAALDAWTHALYDASNNAVGHDTVVGPPHHVRWVAGPLNARHHESLASITVVVSAAGRLFTIIDEAPAASILLRPQWALVARDAFSSVVLWKRPISRWEPHLRGFRSGPPELSRRLVAHGDRVVATLGLREPVQVLDAASGQTLATFKGTEGTEEIRLHDGVLFLVVSPAARRGAIASAPAKSLMALDAATGREVWRRADVPVQPTSVAVGGGRLVYVDDGAVVALDAKTGREHWRTPRAVAKKRPGWSAPTVVASGDVVLCADRQAKPASTLDESTGKKIARWMADGGYPGDLVAYAAATGKELWRCRCAEGYHAPVDVFVIDGIVWVGQSRARHGPDFTVGRDLHSGKIVRRIPAEKAFKTTMPHHRCHRNRATTRYLVTGRTGVEFIDVATGEARRHHWVRGTCQFGTLPSNGLLYAPPHSCACYIEAKLTGFLALAPASEKPSPPTAASLRLERGPAYAAIGNRQSAVGNSSDWPTYRHDAARSGSTTVPVPAKLHVLWKAALGGRISSPVVAEGVALATSVDAHGVYALDARTGKPRWRFTAGGRVDSPPTVAQGLAVFGSADGCVYAVRLADGQLAWRFQAAPEARRIVAFGQLESPWPVHGSVLVENGVVTFAAGRSSYLDGGIHLYRLSLHTGAVLSHHTAYSRDPKTGEQPDEPIMFEMPGGLPDVLSSDGTRVYMRRLAFHASSLAPEKSHPHLYSPAGFLNGDWWHRTYWIYGDHFYSGYIGWYFAGRENAAGRLLCLDDATVYGFGYKPSFYRGATGRQYHLFATRKADLPDPGAPNYQRANRDYPHRGGGKFKVKFTWQKDVPLLGRAMVLAKDTLFVAGPPSKATTSFLAYEGKKGVALIAVAAADGATLGEYSLGALPVHDGMAVAQGRLFVSLENGVLLCLGGAEPGSGAPALAAWSGSAKGPRGKPREPGLAGEWTFDEGAGSVARDSSGLGNDAEVNGEWVKTGTGACVFTNGAPAAITIWDDESLHFGTGNFSLALWVKAAGYDSRLLGKESFPANWWVINILADGRAELVLGTGRGPGQSVRPTSKAPLGKQKWTHLAYTVDRKRSVALCYVNGKLDSTTTIPAKFTAALDVAGQNLAIPSAHKPFVGWVDDLTICRRALAAAEVQALRKRHPDGTR